MNYQLVFTTEADHDLNKIKVWYDQINVQLTNNLFASIAHEMDRMKENPFLVQFNYRNVKVVFLEKFEYGIHLMLKEERIILLSVLHAKQYFSGK
jgi:plasmid stabilization system protein ParE